jgi:hypothetical protein
MFFCALPEQLNKIVIHIHGNFGNFYQNKFLWVMSEIYVGKGIDFLTINLSSHDGLAEGYFGRELKYVGGAVADYNSSQADIDAAINFAINRGYKQIILQGHSLGCDKIVQYTLENHSNMPIILLSPVDSYKVQSEWISPETIDEQVKRLNSNIKQCDEGWGKADFDWLDCKEYGAKGDTSEWVYQIPITRRTLLSILEGSAFKYLNIECGIKFQIFNPTYIFVGKHDGLQMHEPDVWIDFIKKSFINAKISADLDADHDVVGVETEISERIVQWINEL